MIKILPGVLNMDRKLPKLAFCSEIPSFFLNNLIYFLRGDVNICVGEIDEEFTRLCSSSVDVLPSESFSQSRDRKLSITYIFIKILYHVSDKDRQTEIKTDRQTDR